ncbi:MULTISPECIES: VOC family protein [unclassified Streptomyces]|uniref:VOC family protein n=1 Tax=unclassified Streptomyces TaxID=2593676 RepID=UPI0006FF7A7F|nr:MULTISPECIES: VOC family protein [unclassified Streptomyces]KQX57862.1 glyoxalase [Streptomyces sp. Root1304]KRA78746.1 glyoxalase [Streptomyces sp. Root66D1]
MIMKLKAVTLDCADPMALADFYRRATGLPTAEGSDGEFAGLRGADGLFLGFQRVDGYRPPSWPGQEVPQQLHLDFVVDDLDEAAARLVEWGATVPDGQPRPDLWRVVLDPAGHPFCLTIPRGAA